ncbi:hypothetical protein WJ0W_005038 [Paenibacillus melissococcoides]|uniref:Uncharacterized protein n=1 Tax=Paenibacillus melissococcoides TaxID=2912268 RepID=A0ABN8U9L6_9BACL|nr:MULTISPECIES: hypothetical protein [Paenibacillus]MEB9896882.1 hypothetical protein [Bacillus cereus]CAH8247782.1 hypothetical protein WJ0W_005038 [Paenibacillus melissococcoides]CAH8719559.1 hypothetical protein HTL2_005650 [Paenibacillus melissococcoides]CAH8720558.1 hypothetical protein WDD9_005923 [Paenibacillus melissococcoides]GIO81521.1 hypothetical protein J6TS7_51310 [Paenibacillus dendritiformis]
MSAKTYNQYSFVGWMTLELPTTWEYEQDDDVINIFSSVNPKGALQISFYNVNLDISREELAEDFLQKFIDKYTIDVDVNTKMILERDDYTIAVCEGYCDDRFIKVWCLAENKRLLLITYNSQKKNREVSTASDIVYGIRFL